MNIENVDSRIALETVLEIGKKFNMNLSDFLNVESFVNKIIDRIEGKRIFANEMQYLIQYKQYFLTSSSSPASSDSVRAYQQTKLISVSAIARSLSIPRNIIPITKNGTFSIRDKGSWDQ